MVFGNKKKQNILATKFSIPRLRVAFMQQPINYLLTNKNKKNK